MFALEFILSNRCRFWLVPLLGAVLVASCSTSPTVPPLGPAAVAGKPEYPADLHGARLYRIDASASTVHILVYRGGSLARLGHNHVISSRSTAGYVWQHTTADGSGFDIVVPVNELIVDGNEARIAQGGDFPLNVPDEARQGTRENMLSEAVLDGAHYPFIAIRSIGASATSNGVTVTASIQIRNKTQQLLVPVTLESGDNTLRVRGEFEINQTDFGIQPFSVAMGALHVMDAIKVRIDLLASSL